MLAVTASVAYSPSSGIYSFEQRPDMMVADFTPALRVFPQYGSPVTVYPVNTELVAQPKDVPATANSPPSKAGRAT